MCGQTMVRHEGSVTCLLASGGRIFSGGVDSLIKVSSPSNVVYDVSQSCNDVQRVCVCV